MTSIKRYMFLLRVLLKQINERKLHKKQKLSKFENLEMFCNLMIADLESLKRVDIENFLREYQTKYHDLMDYTLLIFENSYFKNDESSLRVNPIWSEYLSITLDSSINDIENLKIELDKKLPAQMNLFNSYIIGMFFDK